MQPVRAAVALLLCASLGAGAAAQAHRAPEIRAEFDAAETQTSRWFLLGFELVEAHIDVDLQTALAVARQLIAAADDDGPAGAREAATALAALCLTMLEGTIPAAELVDRAAGPPPANAAPAMRAYYHLARSRQFCVAGAEGDELAAAIEGRAAANASRDAVLAARAALVFHHVSPDGGTENSRATLDEARDRVRGGQIRFLEPWLLSHEHFFHKEAGRSEEANRILDEIERLAAADGNHRRLGFVSLRRGRFHYHERNDAEAVNMYRAARKPMQRVGDRREFARLIEYEADIEVRRDDLERAAALVDENLALTAGRGIPDCDRGILQTRFDLAIKQHNAELIAELASQLDRTTEHEESEWRRYAAVRNRLARSETERLAAQAQLHAEHERLEERGQLTWTLGSIGVVIALAAVMGIALASRRKLLGVNDQLREQIQRAKQAQAAQARLEERLRQLERTESLGMMASGIAHDFNNLLTCVLGNAELLVMRDEDPERRALAQTITAAGEQAVRMCRQLRSYTGDTPIHLQPVDLNVVVRDMLPVLHTAGNAQLAVRAELDTLPVGAVGDRGQLEQVLLNLVSNARDAGAKTVTIRTARARMETADIERCAVRGEILPGSHAVLEVEDDGEGMSQQLTDRIFDPFFTTRFPGRGLGLAVVYGVVRRHRGGISVQSAPTAGARFRIYVPEARVTAPREVVPRKRHAHTARTIVIADDEPGVRKLLVTALGEVGHEIIATASGADALATLASLATDPPPVLLVDLTMPGMDGSEVLRRVRVAHPRVPVVLMSGHIGGYLDEVTQELRPDGVLLKPFDMATVREVLGTVQSTPTERTVG